MFQKKNKSIINVAIITARKGSRRIKNKNLKLFFGKPIIYYSIKTLQKAKIFDEIIVSTNCKHTEEVSKKFGVNRIIRRPDHMSTNKVGTVSVIKHSIKYLSKINIHPKYVCCLYPAAPLTLYKNIKFAYKLIKSKITKKGFIYPSTFLNKINKKKKKVLKNKLISLIKINKKEGIVNNLFLDAGQFWYAKSYAWIKSNTVYKKNSFTFLIDEELSDINSIKDWKKVKKIYKNNKNKYVK